VSFDPDPAQSPWREAPEVLAPDASGAARRRSGRTRDAIAEGEAMLWEIWMTLAVLVGSLLVVASLPRRHAPLGKSVPRSRHETVDNHDQPKADD